VVLLGILLHDLGWAVVDQREMFEQGFGPNMIEFDVRIQHEKEGARIAREILTELEYDPEIIEHVVTIIDGHDTRKTAMAREAGDCAGLDTDRCEPGPDRKRRRLRRDPRGAQTIPAT
jgi:hypothetical protein